MNADVGLIDQQTNKVGVIPKINLQTFNPPVRTTQIRYSPNTVDFGLINQQNSRIGTITAENLNNYNPRQTTNAKKIVMSSTYETIDFNDKNRPLFYQNQKIPENMF